MSDEIPLPAPDRCRYETQGGEQRIRWPLVDPWLYAVKDQGALATLSLALGISHSALQKRRYELKLGSLPVGRRPSVSLTEYEHSVLAALREGVTKAALARANGVSRAAISQTSKRIQEKLELAESKSCLCGGTGVVPCGIQGEPRCMDVPHNHVCPICGGK